MTPAEVVLRDDAAGARKVAIYTSRLKLISVDESLDIATDLHDLFGDAKVMGTNDIGLTMDHKQKTDFFAAESRTWRTGGTYGGFSILQRASHQFVGYANLRPSSEPGVADVGYVLSHTSWGNGYGFEAVKALVHDYASITAGLGAKIRGETIHTIKATVRRENPAAGRILRKCGFQAGAEYERGTFTHVPYTLRTPIVVTDYHAPLDLRLSQNAFLPINMEPPKQLWARLRAYEAQGLGQEKVCLIWTHEAHAESIPTEKDESMPVHTADTTEATIYFSLGASPM